jgi:hypothetical protein
MNKKKYDKQYYQDNKEKINEYQREQKKAWRQTPSGRKSRRIHQWKFRGVISDDFDALYEKFINTANCENCDILLTEDKIRTATTRCLDHDHSITDRENFRNVLCHVCNTLRDR